MTALIRRVIVLAAVAASVAAAQARPATSAPRALTAFSRAKAEWLLRNRLPCLGCHALRGEGGRIGPDLTELAARRSAQYVSAMIADPQRVVPGTIMPRVPMSPDTRELIASYLLGPRRSAAPRSEAPAGAAGGPRADLTGDAPALYAGFCAPCHGARGTGDGYNARYLPVPPTAHASAAYMSIRTDDELFDAIAAGGYIMNRSARMPPFGQTLSPAQIRGLVRYLRALCGCEGPGWSRDNR